MNDRQELERLRISVARIAQALGVDSQRSSGLGVIGKPYQELAALAHMKERGWSHLAGLCIQCIEDEYRSVGGDSGRG